VRMSRSTFFCFFFVGELNYFVGENIDIFYGLSSPIVGDYPLRIDPALGQTGLTA
jgi:hypothetical protein